MRIESEHRRRQRQVLGGFDEAREHRLMAAMNAVEVADGQCDVVRGGGESAEDLHALGAREIAGRH